MGARLTRSFVFAWVVLGVGIAVVPEARADTAAMARFHYGEAQRHYARRHFEQAIEQFFAAQRLSPNPRTLYNIGLCFLELDRPVQAHHFFTAYLEGEDEVEGAEERRAFARRKVEQLRPRVALVTVTSAPPGAEIFVDHEEHGSYGRTPRQLALAPGEHRIWVVLEGYQDAERTITAVLGEERELELEPTRVLGQLQIDAALAARARVLDAAGALVAEGEVPLREELPPGRYDVEVRAEGYPPWRTVATVEGNATQRVHLGREDLPAPAGSLTVTANAQDAEVRIGGQPAGFTPLSLTALRASQHRVEVRAEGLQPWEGEVELRPDARAWINVTLRPVPAERSWWTWIVGGAGAASILVGAITGSLALVRRDELGASSGPGVDTSALARGVDDLNLATDVTLGVGTVLVGVGIVLFFATDRSSVPASTGNVSWGLE